MSFVSGAVLESVSESGEALPQPSGTIWDIAVAVTCDIADLTPSETVLETHRVAHGAYYQCTAALSRLHYLVRFNHEARDHPSHELMCKIVDNKMFASFLMDSNSKVIRKYFPQCKACPAANMTQKPLPR